MHLMFKSTLKIAAKIFLSNRAYRNFKAFISVCYCIRNFASNIGKLPSRHGSSFVD